MTGICGEGVPDRCAHALRPALAAATWSISCGSRCLPREELFVVECRGLRGPSARCITSLWCSAHGLLYLQHLSLHQRYFTVTRFRQDAHPRRDRFCHQLKRPIVRKLRAIRAGCSPALVPKTAIPDPSGLFVLVANRVARRLQCVSTLS